MFTASRTTSGRCIAAVVALLLLAACSSGDAIGGQRTLDPSLPTAVPDSDSASNTSTASDAESEAPAVAPTPAPTVGPVDCAGNAPGDTFTVPLVLQPGASLDLMVEIRDQAGSEGRDDTVRSWPVTVTVSDRIEDEWLMIWQATRSALELPVGFSTSDANDLQLLGLPPMPPAFYRIAQDGTFVGMEIPAGFGRGVAQSVRDVAAEETDPSVQESLNKLADLYTDAPPDVFEVAVTEAQIFHEFATASFGAEPMTAAGPARASAFLREPLTTAVTAQLDQSAAQRGCAALVKRWSLDPTERGQAADRPVLEATYVGQFDAVTGQPSEIIQTMTLVQPSGDRRDFTTTLTVTRPWG